MKQAIVTKEFAIKAILFGACRSPKIGTPINELSHSELVWAHDAFKPTSEELLEETGETTPLWARAKDGSGYGDGDGYGYGDGYGSGYGDGDGYGYGDGDGDGYGDGDGDGYGSQMDKVYKLLENE